VHYVSARALATFRGGDICLVLVYKATSPVLFGPPVSSSVCHQSEHEKRLLSCVN
jgi:hypothetical protein